MNQVNFFSCHSKLVKNEIALKFNFFDAYLFEIITDCKIDMSCKAKKKNLFREIVYMAKIWCQ